MSRVWYAAFSEDFVEPAKAIFKKLGRDVTVGVWNPDLLSGMRKSGVRVILARGATAIRIRKMTDMPIVEIPIPFEDMVDTLILASGYGKKIGVIGYNNLLGGLELLNPILNVDISQVFAVDTEDTYRQILKWKNENFDVVVGGLIQTHFAQELNMNYVRINLSEKALEYAYQEAEKMIYSLMSATKKTEELNAILNTTKESYIAVDAKGNITLINHMAKKYISSGAGEVKGRCITELFPAFQTVFSVLLQGEEILQETASIRGTEILYDMIPLKYQDSEVLGAIITFNDIRVITQGEHKIRERIRKGFYASYRFEDIAGDSGAVRECMRIAKKYAKTDFTILVLGETGAGKEMFAQSMHRMSSRSQGPFVAVNCAALPEGILESELFGYEEGAFTGAKKSGKMGLFELAHKGTIFLDEISEMPLSLQSRLLRVLQEKRVMRLGGDRLFPVDIRVFAATNSNLIQMVRARKFREDLFYRLNVLTLKIPSLRERKEDIPLLAQEFLNKSGNECVLTKEAVKVMQDYQWPGNVRQLMHFMEKVRIISEAAVITGNAVAGIIENYEPAFECEDAFVKKRTPAPVTKEELLEVLDKTGGSKTEAAELLGMHRSTLWRYLKKYEIVD